MVSKITVDTNYDHIDIISVDQYDDFLQRVKFPTHALIVRALDDNTIIKKGITNFNELNKTLISAFLKHQKIRLKTSMRAMMNPTRMSIIHNLAIKLVHRLKQKCKKCGLPGFGKPSLSGNLVCEICGSKTDLYQNSILSCVKYDYHQILHRQDKLKKSDPTHCSYCNP